MVVWCPFFAPVLFILTCLIHHSHASFVMPSMPNPNQTLPIYEFPVIIELAYGKAVQRCDKLGPLFAQLRYQYSFCLSHVAKAARGDITMRRHFVTQVNLLSQMVQVFEHVAGDEGLYTCDANPPGRLGQLLIDLLNFALVDATKKAMQRTPSVQREYYKFPALGADAHLTVELSNVVGYVEEEFNKAIRSFERVPGMDPVSHQHTCALRYHYILRLIMVVAYTFCISEYDLRALELIFDFCQSTMLRVMTYNAQALFGGLIKPFQSDQWPLYLIENDLMTRDLVHRVNKWRIHGFKSQFGEEIDDSIKPLALATALRIPCDLAIFYAFYAISLGKSPGLDQLMENTIVAFETQLKCKLFRLQTTGTVKLHFKGRERFRILRAVASLNFEISRIAYTLQVPVQLSKDNLYECFDHAVIELSEKIIPTDTMSSRLFLGQVLSNSLNLVKFLALARAHLS